MQAGEKNVIIVFIAKENERTDITMSASRKKKERNMQKAEAGKQNSVFKTHRETITILCIAAVVLAVVIVAAVIYSRYREERLLKPDYDVNIAAATVGSESLSVPILNYYYMNELSSFYGNYSNYISMFLDPSVALDQQEYTGATFFGGDYANWDEYFLKTAENSAREIYNLKQAAAAEGYTLSEEGQTSVESAIESLQDSAKKGGYHSANAYLSSIYGPGCTEENYRQYVEDQQLANEFYNAHINEFSFTDKEIQAAYDADASEYDGVNFYGFYSSASTTDEDGNTVEPTEEDIQAAKGEANAMLASFDEEHENVNLYEDRNKSSVSSGISEDAAEWLFDSARKAGDVQMFALEDGYTFYVLKYESRDDHNYDMANLKVIYIAKDADTAEDTAQDAEEDSETVPAADRYQAVLDSLSQDGSEENFDALASEYSENSTVETSNVTKSNGYGDEATEWIFSNPAEGDYKSFETDSGYYVLLHKGYGENYQHYLVNNSLVADAQNDWIEANAHTNELVLNDDMRQYRRQGITLNDYFAAPSTT